MTGIEPVTPSLPRKCSTSEPHQHCVGFTAHIQIYYQNLFVLSIPIFNFLIFIFGFYTDIFLFLILLQLLSDLDSDTL